LVADCDFTKHFTDKIVPHLFIWSKQ